MASLFCDPALLQDKNPVRVAHGGKPVGDHDHCLSLNKRLKRLLDQILVVGVCKCSCLIQKHNGRILKDCPGQGDPLHLSTGQVGALGPHHSIQALGHFFNNVLTPGSSHCPHHFLLCGLRPGGPDIV